MFVFKSFKRLPTSGSCIPNILSNGCVARYNTNTKIFFNRKREIAEFTNVFSKEPKLHIILGPPSTGKTALVQEIIRSSKRAFNPLIINLRNGQFDTPQRVYDSIYSQFNPFFKKHKDLLKNAFGGKISLGYAGYNLGYKLFDKYKEKTSNDVTTLLDKISTYLPNWSFWYGNNVPPPILVIDEANLFSQLGKTDSALLKSILNWFVLNTKEKQRFHVVLTSSDSFFFDWIINLLNVPHATPYVVGDLSREEAKEYFEKHVLPRCECKELEGKFDQIRKITGTRMLIIDQYVDEYESYKKHEGALKEFKESKFSIYESEYLKLKNGLFPKELRYSDKPDPPRWEDYHLVKTMEEIVKAEDRGFILQDDLISTIGFEPVDSLVSYNFLHRRPTWRFAYDIIDLPNKIILTAMNQPSVCAMKQVLSEVAEAKKK